MRIYQTLIAGLAITCAPADSARAGGNADGPVAEIVTFKQNAGVEDTRLIEVAHGTQRFVAAAPGFVSRRLSKGEDGTWTDYVLWTDMASALAAGAAVMNEPSFAPFMQAIDPDSVAMRHEAVVWSLGE